MAKPTPDQLRAFAAEIDAVCRKHGLTITTGDDFALLRIEPYESGPDPLSDPEEAVYEHPSPVWDEWTGAGR